jgi:hypothetical protein
MSSSFSEGSSLASSPSVACDVPSFHPALLAIFSDCAAVSFGGLYFRAPQTKLLVPVDVVCWIMAHYYNHTILYLLNKHFVNTLDVSRTKCQW